MSRRTENTRRSNHSIFLPQNFGSPFNDMSEHIAGLGLARLDFERCAVAEEVIYNVEGDSTPTSQQEEEARIATLAYALKKLGNPEDAGEFMRCLNAICEEGDARYRQVAASYYYGEISERGAAPVLKEMALIAMNLASLNPALEGILEDCFGDFHLNAMRNNRSYRRFYAGIRRATDTMTISELMKQAYEARQNDNLSVKHFIALNTAADNQRERLLSAPLSVMAYRFIEEIVTASEKLGYLGWAMYGDNNPSPLIHTLDSQEQTRIWEFITARKAIILLPRHYAKLCSTWGRGLPFAWFILPVAVKTLLELPRLRKVLNVVRNKQGTSIRKSFSTSMAAVPTHGAPAMKKDAAVKSRAEAATGGQR